MKILYDANGLIWSAVTNQNSLEVPTGYFMVQLDSAEEINKLKSITEPGYGYPLYKYVGGIVSEITDYNDYASNMTAMKSFMDKRKKDFSEMIEKSSLDSLRDLFRSLNADEQLMFRKCFSEYWSVGASTQTDINLAFEGMFRVLIKAMYIKDVLKRDLTVDEQTEYENLLTLFYNHNELVEPYLPSVAWSIPLIDRVMDEINGVRFNHVFPKLAYITEPEGE